MPIVVPTTVVTCDIVRMEQGGKYYCLGIYPQHSISIKDFNIPVVLSFYIDIFSDSTGAHNVQYRMHNHSINQLAIPNKDSTIILDYKKTLPLTVGPLSFSVPGPSDVSFDIGIYGIWTELVKVSIVAAEL